MPGVRVTRPEGTYLLWLDLRDAGLAGSPAEFIKEQAKVAVNEGRWFGEGGDGFVRLNFGCPRSTLRQGLEQMAAALAAVPA